VHLAYTDAEEGLRSELRAYYDRLLDDDTVRDLRHAEGIGPVMRRVVRQMGADGWLGIGWPTEYGGQGRGPIDQFIFFDESMRAGAPVPMLTINSVAPTLMEFGSDEQKRRFLPRILAGEIHFCIGYSEPGAGTDLASLRTRAVRDGDSYVITGQKMWTSLASDADYCWLAARTGADDSRHRGISIFVAAMDSPGIERTPLRLLSSHDICSVYWDDVRIPAENLVAGENEGWKLIVNQLNHERVTLCSPGMAEHMLHETIDWARTTSLPDGRRVIDQEWVRVNLAKAYAGFEFLRLANWKVAWDATRNHLDVADASTIKVFGTEHYLESFRLLMEVLGERAYLTEDAPGALLSSRLEQMYRSLLILTFGGGTNELQRDLIAAFGMGMPMAKRG
jgi:alkylation response protein AidB-like acyl-CoA dehydrogenase